MNTRDQALNFFNQVVSNVRGDINCFALSSQLSDELISLMNSKDSDLLRNYFKNDNYLADSQRAPEV